MRKVLWILPVVALIAAPALAGPYPFSVSTNAMPDNIPSAGTNIPLVTEPAVFGNLGNSGNHIGDGTDLGYVLQTGPADYEIQGNKFGDWWHEQAPRAAEVLMAEDLPLIEAYVTNQSQAVFWDKAGVMVVDELHQGTRFVNIFLCKGSVIFSEAYDGYGAGTGIEIVGPGSGWGPYVANIGLRLEENPDGSISGYYDLDDTPYGTWTLMATSTPRTNWDQNAINLDLESNGASEVSDIDNWGLFVSSNSDSGRSTAEFHDVKVPEPATLSLLAAAIGGCLIRRRR